MRYPAKSHKYVTKNDVHDHICHETQLIIIIQSIILENFWKGNEDCEN